MSDLTSAPEVSLWEILVWQDKVPPGNGSQRQTEAGSLKGNLQPEWFSVKTLTHISQYTL